MGAWGLTLLPFFIGERTPDLPTVRGILHGINRDNLISANLCRAAVEGVRFGLRFGVDLLSSFGLAAHEIRLIGGGASSPAWRQLIADMTNTPVSMQKKLKPLLLVPRCRHNGVMALIVDCRISLLTSVPTGLKWIALGAMGRADTEWLNLTTPIIYITKLNRKWLLRLVS